MANKSSKALLFRKLLLIEIILTELFSLLTMISYKYYLNYPSTNFLSIKTLKIILSNYSFFYTGNLICVIFFIIALISIINLYIKTEKSSDGGLKIILILELICFFFLIIILVLSGKETLDDLTGKVIQLDERGSQILSLAIYTVLKVFTTISLAVISFNVLKKFYFFRSIWITFILMVVSSVVLFIIVHNYKDDLNLLSSEKRQIDAGIILGAAAWGNRPSPVLRERINKGYELFRDGYIKNIVLTGGGSPGWKTEADVAKEELKKKSVPEKYIFIENQSNSTLQQISYVNRNLYISQNWKNVILISDNFHLFRSKQISKFFKMETYTVSSETPLSTESGINYTLKESFAILFFWLYGIG